MKIIYSTLSGSHLYGLNDEKSDVDYDSVFLPDAKSLFGIGCMDHTSFQKRASEDYTYYSLQKFGLLLSKGNFKALEILYAPESLIVSCHDEFRKLLDIKQDILSLSILEPLYGFALSNFKSIDKQPTGGFRKEMFDKLGYDSKYLAHVYRILFVGKRFLETGIFSVDCSEIKEDFSNIRHGVISRRSISNQIEKDLIYMKNLIEEYKKEKKDNHAYELINYVVMDITRNLINEGDV